MSSPAKRAEPFAVQIGGSSSGPSPPGSIPPAKEMILGRGSDEALRVVVVDDDDAILEDILEALHLPLFSALASRSADEFFCQLESLSPHVVLVDLQMSGRDGIDILVSLRDQSYRGEIVLMSGVDNRVLQTARRMGASFGLNITGSLRKPFSPGQLIAAIDRNRASGRAGEMRIRTALNAREIIPYFQPKILLSTGEITGAEALSRWHHPERGLLLPGGYLKTVQAGGGQSLHDFSILEGALETCAKLNSAGVQMKFAVNFTADVVMTNEFLIVLKDALQRHAVAPEQFIIELTESDAAENMGALTERLLKLRLYGAHLSIDDFGTGHSTLTRLQHLPVSEIKIDRSFVSGLTEYSDDFAIVRSIVDLAHSIQCPVVAEGVETLDTLEALKKVGCDMAQGHIFSPAVNEATFLALVASRTGIGASPERALT